MARNSGVSMPDSLIDTVDDHHCELGFQYRSRFVQQAVVEKLRAEGVDVEDVDPTDF